MDILKLEPINSFIVDEVLHVSWKCPKEVDRYVATEKRPRVEIRGDLDKNEELEIFSSWGEEKIKNLEDKIIPKKRSRDEQAHDTDEPDSKRIKQKAIEAIEQEN